MVLRWPPWNLRCEDSTQASRQMVSCPEEKQMKLLSSLFKPSFDMLATRLSAT